MSISNVALTNTFDEWRVTTNQLIVVTNDLLGDGLTTYRSVTANVVTANSLFFGTLNVVPTLSAAYDKANSANVVAVSAFGKANAANVIASAGFDKANSANVIASAAFDKANVANNNASNTVLRTGDTMTGTLVVPNVNVSSNIRMTGGLVDIAKANILSQTLTDAATITWDGSLGQIATVTLTANRAISNVTNLKVGTYILHVVQGGTGNNTLQFNLGYRFTGNLQPQLTPNVGARDMFSFASDGSRLYGAMIPDVG
jgi:hypothetical protein